MLGQFAVSSSFPSVGGPLYFEGLHTSDINSCVLRTQQCSSTATSPVIKQLTLGKPDLTLSGGSIWLRARGCYTHRAPPHAAAAAAVRRRCSPLNQLRQQTNKAAAAALTAAAQNRSLVKNQRFLPLLNFSSNSFLASCKGSGWKAGSSDSSRVKGLAVCRRLGGAAKLPGTWYKCCDTSIGGAGSEAHTEVSGQR